MLRAIDAILNRFTMYRVVLYGLAALLVAADALAFTGVLSIAPVGLLVSVATLVVSCYGANRLLAWLFRVPYNAESWLITALILACILPPVHTMEWVVLVAICGALAMASKYLLVFRGNHFLNPAATGAFIVSVTGLLPVTWWVATPYLVPVTALLALVVLRKQRAFSIFFSFTLAALPLLWYVGSVVHGQPALSVLRDSFLSWPIIFMGSIMLTEPSTLPSTKLYQRLFAVLVGVVFASQLQVGPVATTPQLALLVGNIFTLAALPAMGAMVRLKQITPIGPNMYDVAFERPAHLRFTPGQYLEWTLPHRHADSRGNRRLFSIASSPTEPDLHIGIKTYQPSSSFKQALLALRPGALLRVAHVAGSFTLPPLGKHNTPLVLIAGGIGITPFRSILCYLADTGQRRNVTLLYIAATEADFVYHADIRAAEAIGLQTHYVTGKIEDDTLRTVLPPLKQSLVYISGPDGFVTHYKQTLIRFGTPRGHIRTDHFTGY